MNMLLKDIKMYHLMDKNIVKFILRKVYSTVQPKIYYLSGKKSPSETHQSQTPPCTIRTKRHILKFRIKYQIVVKPKLGFYVFQGCCHIG